MGCWLTKPAEAIWNSTPSPKAIAKTLASSLRAASSPSARPPSPTSPLDVSSWETKRRPRPPRALPLGTSLTYKCRKNERACVEPSSYVTEFVASGCEDCVFVVPCAVGVIRLSDCKRCVFVFGPTRDAAVARDCLDVTYVCVGTSGRVTFEECHDVRAHVRVIGEEAEGETVRFERCGKTRRGAMDVRYEDAVEQMRALGFEGVDACDDDAGAIESASGKTAFDILEERGATTFDDAGFAFSRA